EELIFVQGAGINGNKVCLPNTRQKILKEISDWAWKEDSKMSKTFLLCGEAGTGKSAIAHTVAQRLQNDGFLVAFFAFDRSLPMSRTPSNALSTIAYTLGVGDAHFKEGLIRAFEEDPSVSSGESIQRKWEKLIVAPAQRVDSTKHVAIILDALDESGPQEPDGPRDSLLSVLIAGENDLPSNFRVFTTSRLENDVIVYVEKFINVHSSLRIQKMNNLEGAEDDIYKFVVGKMSKGGGLGILDNTECRALAAKAEGYFQWASTVCKALSGVSARFKEFISTAPGNHKDLAPLDSLYQSILTECFDCQNREAMKAYKNVMALVLAMFEPLTKSSLKNFELRGRQDHSITANEGGTVNAVLNFLGSLFTGVDEPNIPIKPVHTSIRDFLLDETRSGVFVVNIVQGHTTLARGSLEVMMMKLHFNMCSLESSYVFNSQVMDMKNKLAQGIHHEVEYASCFLG
ncbi:hypothetical protein BDP27DRAFT_1251054, partial [Rhodocollybia butyracea]